VITTGLGLDARVHADAQQLLITSIVARLRQGGQIEGTVALDHWLPPVPGGAEMQPSGMHVMRASGTKVSRTPIQLAADAITIPVNGKVTAQFKNVTVDTILDMVGVAPFQRLGLDAMVNGPADATWVKGDVLTLSVVSTLDVTPSGKPQAGEVATSGIIDGTYTQRDGAVDLRKLVVHTPASEVEAHGKLGAYPMTSPSALFVDARSRNLGEFDTIFTKLGLTLNGKTGIAALPVNLAGQADFHGSWAGSLTYPRLAGTLKATQIAMEMPSAAGVKAGPPNFLRWDTVEATGSYSEERIAIEHGLLRRGKTEIALDGTLSAVPAKLPEYDLNSPLRMHLRATKLGMDDLLPFTGQLPLTGTMDAQLDLSGQRLRSAGGAHPRPGLDGQPGAEARFDLGRRGHRQDFGDRQLRFEVAPLPGGRQGSRYRCSAHRGAASARIGADWHVGVLGGWFGHGGRSAPGRPRGHELPGPERGADGRAGADRAHRQPAGYLRRNLAAGDSRTGAARSDRSEQGLYDPGRSPVFPV
jgi:translocation and assembly module TamB